MKTYFFKNVENYEELLCKSQKKYGSLNMQDYEIIDTIKLCSKEYEDFCSRFKYNYIFLFKYADDMKIVHDIWKCVLVKSDEQTGVLVTNNGYLYPAFTAIPANLDET